MTGSMAKARGNLEEATKWIVLILLAFLALVFGGIFLVFFAPIVGFYIFHYSDKIKKLEAQLATLQGTDEKPKSK